MTTYRLFLALMLWSPSLLWAQPAPDFTITATDNEMHQLYADYLDNGKTVVLDIMFTTCPPCNSIAPLLEPLYQEWGAGQEDVVFFSLSDKAFDDNTDVAAFEATHGQTFHGAGQDGGSLSAVAPYKAGTYGAFNGTPTFVVIAPDGTVIYNPRGSNRNATVDSIGAAIEATGAMRPVVNYSVGGQLTNADGQPLTDVSVYISSQTDPEISSGDGSFQFPTELQGSTISIRPENDNNYRNGVALIDLVLLQRHMLFIDTLDSPYKYFAADINRSRSLSPSDLVLLQRFLLFLDNDFANNTSWRFIPSDFTFLNPSNPLVIHPPDSIIYSDLNGDQANTDFIGVKIGDVNSNADPNSLWAPEDQVNLGTPQVWQGQDQALVQGQSYQLTIRGSYRDMYAINATLGFDPQQIKVTAIESLAEGFAQDVVDNQGRLAEGFYHFSWMPMSGERSAAQQEDIMVIEIKALQNLDHLPLTLAGEVYHTDEQGELLFSNLNLDLKADQTTSTRDLSKTALAFYPNPTQDYVWLTRSENGQAFGSLEVRNSLGQVVKTVAPSAALGDQAIDLGDLPKGLYLLYSQTAQQAKYLGKVLKQ